jgi:hypothetical protein
MLPSIEAALNNQGTVTMSHAETTVQHTAPDTREADAKTKLSELVEKELGQQARKVELTPWVDMDRNEQNMVSIRLHPQGQLAENTPALRRHAQRIAAMMDIASENTEQATRADINNHAITLNYAGTLQDLAQMNSAAIQPEQVQDTQIAKTMVFPLLKEVFPTLKAEEINVTERDSQHVDITIEGPHRFTNRKAARAFTDALESGSGETIITNLNGAPIGAANGDDGKHVHIEYKGGLKDLLGADWLAVQKSMRTSKAKGGVSI